jgi:hypothetical protein
VSPSSTSAFQTVASESKHDYPVNIKYSSYEMLTYRSNHCKYSQQLGTLASKLIHMYRSDVNNHDESTSNHQAQTISTSRYCINNELFTSLIVVSLFMNNYKNI